MKDVQSLHAKLSYFFFHQKEVLLDFIGMDNWTLLLWSSLYSSASLIHLRIVNHSKNTLGYCHLKPREEFVRDQLTSCGKETLALNEYKLNFGRGCPLVFHSCLQLTVFKSEVNGKLNTCWMKSRSLVLTSTHKGREQHGVASRLKSF